MSRLLARIVCGAKRGFALYFVAAILVPESRSLAAELRWRVPSGGATEAFVEVAGVTESSPEAMDRLAVYVRLDDLARDLSAPQMLGSKVWKTGVLTFTPRFPLLPGRSYRAVYRAGDQEPLVAHFDVPKVAALEATTVDAVYPSGATLPENLLKFYLHFSAPMRRGSAYEHVGLFRDDGSRVELPFLEIDQELWDPDQKRLTLLIDPGRIKRGVKPLEDIGPALEAGGTYELRIDSQWIDANGSALRTPFVKRFDVGSFQRRAIDLELWTLEAIRVGTTDPLMVRFDRAMDHALALRLIDVVDDDGRVQPTDKRVLNGETVMEMTPESDWKARAYRLRVATTLEDLTGANVGKPFEVDVVETGRRRIESEWVYVPLESRKP